MEFKQKMVVVKFNDLEKYAVPIFSGSKEECGCKAAWCRGLYHEVKHIKFSVYPAFVYDECKNI